MVAIAARWTGEFPANDKTTNVETPSARSLCISYLLRARSPPNANAAPRRFFLGAAGANASAASGRKTSDPDNGGGTSSDGDVAW